MKIRSRRGWKILKKEIGTETKPVAKVIKLTEEKKLKKENQNIFLEVKNLGNS
jgi:hypothetical protein